jgi:predicted deacylase
VTDRRTLVRAPVATLSNGHRLGLVLHRVRGGADGPRLGVIAGIHGDEPLGIEIVRRLLAELEDETFRGELIALPVANPYAFSTLTRNTPVDAANLNRVFPGNPDGTLTEQVAHVVCAELLGSCDTLIDVHSGGNLATVDYVYLTGDEELAKVFGCELLYRSTPPAGSLAACAGERNVETLIVELGGGQQCNEHFVQKGLRGVRNLMKHLGMLDGDPELPDAQLIVSELADLKPHEGGLLLSSFGPERLGEAVAAGVELARVVSPYTLDVLESIAAPFDPTLLVLVREAVTKVDPGDYGFIVANGATAVVA